ncbi:putative ribonuclease H-like domain-containing protein [Tanacetum coccineum]
MSTSNQQTLAYSRANERPPMLERGNYIPWESRFKRFLDNKLEEGERMNQVFNAGNGNDNNNQIIQRVPQTKSTLGKANVQCYNYNERGHYARDCQKLRVRDAKYFREQMLLSMKDKVKSTLTKEENDFMLDTTYEEESMEELTIAVNASSKVYERMRHEKPKTIIQTSDDDQIDLNIIFDDPYVENNGGTSDHDLNDHDDYHKIKMLACDELEMYLKRELRNDKNTIERILKEKDNIQSDFFKIENEKIIIQHETQLAKKAFKEREDTYLEEICNLEEKLSSHDRIVYKMGQYIQTIHMLGKTPNKVYDPFLKAGLGYKNLECLKKAIAAQPKMYDGEKLHSTKLVIHSPNSEETLEDAEESRLKMRNEMVQINYAKLNALYETFVPQQEFFAQQTYFSIPSTSINSSESKEVTSALPVPKMPKQSKLLKMLDTPSMEIDGLRIRIDNTLLEDQQRRWISESQNSLK